MDDLLKKLNTLVSAQVNELAAKIPGLGGKPDVNRQITDLRERVNTAMAHEEELRNTVLTLRDEIANLDSQVNNALQNGQEPIARSLLDQMQRLEKRLAFAEADLRQHQSSAADLIGRVSALEAAVQNAANPPAAKTQAPTAPPAQRTATSTAPKGAGSIGAMMDAALGTEKPSDAITPAKPAAEAPKLNEKPIEPTPQAEKPTGQAQNRPTDSEKPAEGAVPKPWIPATETVASGGETAPAPQQQPLKPQDEAEDIAEKPYTAKDLARDARDEAEKQLERTNQGVESVGGMLRDIQARTKSRIESLDKMLRDGGLLDPFDEAPPAKKPSGDAPSKKEKDLEDRLKRLSKPD